MIPTEKRKLVPLKVSHLFSSSLMERLLALRQDLHQHPELPLQEERTAQKLYDELARLKPVQLERIAGTGVLARIKGQNSKAKIVALRGDIDALPIQEATGLTFASTNDGLMHACGHDVHAAWIIGAAHLLSENPAAGDILLILQPAEELARGAIEILKTGALDGISAIFGGHVDRRFEVGQVVAQSGVMGASTDVFEIELHGSPGHGARPHEAIDPIVGAGALIMALQTIVSRRLNPALPGVVSVGTVNGGSASNIIPESVRLTGTLRATTPDVRKLLQNEIMRIAESTANAYRLKADISIRKGTPPVVNHEEPAEWARGAAVSLLGETAVVPMGFQNMGGEDFAYYLEKVPGCFIRIGAREIGGKPLAAHSPHFFVPDESIFIGAAVLAETARVASESLNT